MKTKMMMIVLLATFGGAEVARACSYFIDEAAKSNELKIVAQASLGGAAVRSASVSDFKFFESKPTPMCPEEMTYTASVTLSYKPSPRMLTVCNVTLDVKKIESWKDGESDSYIISGMDSKKCAY